jgi:hypothetical protein
MIIERIKFYADTPRKEKNKLFCFKCSLLNLEDCLMRFILRGFEIKAAWYEKIECTSGLIIENSRINNLQIYYDKSFSISKKERDRIMGISLKRL